MGPTIRQGHRLRLRPGVQGGNGALIQRIKREQATGVRNDFRLVLTQLLQLMGHRVPMRLGGKDSNRIPAA